MAVTRKDTAALTGTDPATVPAPGAETDPAIAPEPGAAPDPTAAPVVPFLSEGVRGDLAAWGKATDPATGGTFASDPDTAKVTFTDRAGNVTEL
jgi:hypothetical protein